MKKTKIRNKQSVIVCNKASDRIGLM